MAKNKTHHTRERSEVPAALLRKNVDKKNRHAVTIVDREPEEVFKFWRTLSNLPKFMQGITKVEALSPKRSQWTAELKGQQFEWESEITKEVNGEMLSWESVGESDISTNGTVWFSPAPEGTVVSLVLSYDIPGGKFAELAAFLKGEHPDALAQMTLYRLRALLETGEIPTTVGQPSGREVESQTLH